MSDKKQVTHTSILQNLVDNPPIFAYSEMDAVCLVCHKNFSISEWYNEIEKSSVDWYKENYKLHTEQCPYRQAVESLQDDEITPEKLEALGFKLLDGSSYIYRLEITSPMPIKYSVTHLEYEDIDGRVCAFYESGVKHPFSNAKFSTHLKLGYFKSLSDISDLIRLLSR